MATGDPVVQIIREQGPTTLFAPFVQRTGGSTPAELAGVWAFDAATIEYKDFLCLLEPF